MNKDKLNVSRRKAIRHGMAGVLGLTSAQMQAVAAQPISPSEPPLAGQVALVTGAARGIGRALALELARLGAKLVLVDIGQNIKSVAYPLATRAELNETKRLVEQTGTRAVAVTADVRDRASLKTAADGAVREWGRLDILCANAGICTYVPRIEDMSAAEWQDVLDVNLTGAAHAMQAVIPHMRSRRQGRIITIISTEGRHGAPGLASYSAAKWGLVGLTKSVAIEVATDNITVNGVCPTGTRTAMTENVPTYRWANPKQPTRESLLTALRSYNVLPKAQLEPTEVAAAALFFARPEAATITGEILDVALGANTRWTA